MKKDRPTTFTDKRGKDYVIPGGMGSQGGTPRPFSGDRIREAAKALDKKTPPKKS